MLRLTSLALVAAIAGAPIGGTTGPSLSLERAGQAGMLSGAGMQMDVGYVHEPDGDIQVTATVASHDGPGPRVIVLHLADGERTVFAVPGQGAAKLRFERRGTIIIAEIDG